MDKICTLAQQIYCLSISHNHVGDVTLGKMDNFCSSVLNGSIPPLARTHHWADSHCYWILKSEPGQGRLSLKPWSRFSGFQFLHSVHTLGILIVMIFWISFTDSNHMESVGKRPHIGTNYKILNSQWEPFQSHWSKLYVIWSMGMSRISGRLIWVSGLQRRHNFLCFTCTVHCF